MTKRLEILLGSLLGAVILSGAVMLVSSQLDSSDNYQDRRLLEHRRPGPMDPTRIWSSIRYHPEETLRALGIAENHGTYVFWESVRFPRYDDVLHTSRGYCREIDSEVVVYGPFGHEFVLTAVTIDGVSCLVPDGMGIEEAYEEGWILVSRDAVDATRPFSCGAMTLLDSSDFRIGNATIERKKDTIQPAPE